MNKLLFLLLVFWTTTLFAQSSSPEIISSSGGTGQGTSIQIDWTLGELAITTIQNSAHQITQGFHQPNYIITSVEELPQEIGKITIYPNPTSDWLEFNLDFTQNEKVQIQLINMQGKVIWTISKQGMKITEKTNLAELPSATYFLHFLLDGNQYLKTFKVQKLN